jgi:hypothetical protein
VALVRAQRAAWRDSLADGSKSAYYRHQKRNPSAIWTGAGQISRRGAIAAYLEVAILGAVSQEILSNDREISW